MQVFLIEENTKENFLKSIFKKTEVKNDKILINCKLNRLKLRKKIKIIEKIKYILNINNVKNIIISKNLKKDRDLKNLLYSNNFNIIDGRKLWQKMSCEMVEDICLKNQIKMQESCIGITVNNANNYSINSIINLSKKFKTLNIVTNNINYFKVLKEKLWEENGIIITLTNNRKKALAKANIILNFDFPSEVINEYIIFDESIIINLEECIKIKKKRFCGKVINDYNIETSKNTEISEFLSKNEYKNFSKKDLAEVYIINNPAEIQNIKISL